MKQFIVSLFFILITHFSYTQFAVNTSVPEIVLPDKDGTMQQLSSLRGKVVLVDFWASWCLPCRFANKKLRKIYAGNKEKGFEIFGVSLDKRSIDWQKAIQQDGYNWLHVIDQENRLVAAWNIYAIPFTLLIDREGKIMAINPSRRQLKKALNKLLTQ